MDTPHPVCGKKANQVGPEGWCIINYPCSPRLPNKQGVPYPTRSAIGRRCDKTNSPIVGASPGYGFHPLPGPSREWRPCPFPIMLNLGIKSFAHTLSASGLIISLNEVFGDIMVLASPPCPPVDPDDVNASWKVFNWFRSNFTWG